MKRVAMAEISPVPGAGDTPAYLSADTLRSANC